MPAELTAQEMIGAARRAPGARAQTRWLARAFLEFQFQEDGPGQVEVARELSGLARDQRPSCDDCRFAAYAVDGIVASAAHDDRAERQLAQAAGLFEVAGLRGDPLWVEVMAHVCIRRGREEDVPALVRETLAGGGVGSADSQRLECVLGLAELRRGHRVQAAAAFNEASLPTGMVDETRQLWAEVMLSLMGEPGSFGSLSVEELRVVAAATDGLSVAETAHRLALPLSSVKFFRHELYDRLGLEELGAQRFTSGQGARRRQGY